MNRRRLAALLALPAAAALAACTSSSGKSNGNNASNSASKPAGPTSAPSTISAATLADRMRSALAGVTSARFTLSFSVGTTAFTGSGAEKLNNGKLVALKVTEVSTAGSNGAELIIVDGKTYAKLPPSLAKTTKPYVLVTPNSKNPVVRALAPQVDSALGSATLSSVTAFATAAKSVRDNGSQLVNGTPTRHYSVLVDVTKLPAQLQKQIGGNLATLPLEVYLDAQNRPVLYTETATLAGQRESVRVTLSDYNKPVTITAPPAGQVGSS